ncbi:chemotaxis protein CheY [Sorangium cellulosum]|uniref:Chemotaxis protein CheY n=1 Tax=Sorangium cellulosum TaxID=56 RepID=A0A2L0ETV6_SORCE|nr:response regulator [Sorangium cellulosum]AUX42709.1 chemotaxis protein CheY [Sorangium cellulosum]
MKAQVLIVDDSLTIRMDLRTLLTGAGFVVTACETKALAQKVLRAKSFSLAILDVLLPDGDGLDVLREIRSTPDLMHIPVILLSTEIEVRHRIQGLSTGADEYIGKPYDGSYLVLRATELVSQHRTGAHAPGAGAFSVTGKKILVVDDSPTYRASLGHFLRQDGCDVIPAQSGEEALSLLAVERVDCVIMDLLMPGMGGLEAARRIKQSSALCRVPVIILTGHDDAATREEGARIGVEDFVLKTPELAMLRKRLRTLFRPRSSPGADGGAPPRRAGSSSDEPPPSSRAGAITKSMMPLEGSLFEQVVAASGLSSVIGPSTIVRACRRAGIEPRSMSPEDLYRALPAIHETLRMFLNEEDSERGIAAIGMLARGAASAAG